MSELAPCPHCKKPPGTKTGPPAMARCVTPECEGTKLGASTFAEWNVYATPSPSAQTHAPPVCVYCDNDLSCDRCGMEQPYTDISIAKADLAAASARIGEMEKENFALAANQCHAGYGDDYGNHRCEKIDGLKDALLGLIEAVELDSDKGGKGISGYTAARLTDARAALSQTEEGR